MKLEGKTESYLTDKDGWFVLTKVPMGFVVEDRRGTLRRWRESGSRESTGKYREPMEAL